MIMLAAVGRMKAGPERQLFDRYWQRSQPLARKLGFGDLALAELREASGAGADQRKAAEAQALFDKLPDTGALIAFDERGKSLSSPAFATMLADHREDRRPIAAVIGGPDGLDASVRKKATNVIGFGALTIPHQLVRVLVAEQVYRALTMLDGHPYHRD
ncbi:MAG: 23S rRNA (pseudouridine(1915)-N(3))-methyltransferase RlmH [Pseudomonadota bacterium]